MSGPKPSYQPKFSEEELRLCRQLVRQRNAPHIQVQRARLALLLAEAPDTTTAQLARKLGAGTSFVLAWRKRWALGLFSLDDRPRSGRPCRSPASLIRSGPEPSLPGGPPGR